VNFKTIEILAAPKWARRLSELIGLAAAIGWLCYVAYASIANHLGWPRGDEQLDIAAVGFLSFGVGWAAARITFGVVQHLPGRIVSNGPRQRRSHIETQQGG
jgi:hypothetical protein